MLGLKNNKGTGFGKKEVTAAAMKSAGAYIRTHMENGMFNMDECLAFELSGIKAEYKRRKECSGGRKVLTSEDISFLTDTFMGLHEELVKMTENKLLLERKSAKVKAINETTARAVIEGILDRSGLPYKIISQKYRLKVIVGLERKSVLLMHIHYRDIAGKDVEELLPALMTINSVVGKK